MQEINIKQDQIVTSHDDVVITITDSIPQPDIISKTTKTVGEIKNRIKSIDEDIINLTNEKESLQTLLDSSLPEVQKVSLVNEVI